MRRTVVDANGFGLIRLDSGSGVRAEFLPSGVLFALRHDSTLINQVLPGPAEDGLFRLLVRWSAGSLARGRVEPGWAPLVGPGLDFARDGRHAVTWTTAGPGGCGGTAWRPPTLNGGCGGTAWRPPTLNGGCGVNLPIAAATTFALHPELAGWTWRVHVQNVSRSAIAVDVLHVQDLGLADEAAVRSNEAYVSQYLDLLPVADPVLGWIILARQNEAMAGGRHPWLAVGSATGADAFCSDGWQFFGADHRLTGEPVAVRAPSLPSRRLQYECAVAGLQSRSVELPPGATAEITFCAAYLADHPAASGAADAERLHALIAARSAVLPDPTCESLADRSPDQPRAPTGEPPSDRAPESPPAAASESFGDATSHESTAGPSTVASGGRPGSATRRSSGGPTSLFTHAAWLHGAEPTAAEWNVWFPGVRRHEERADDGTVLAFFHGADTHVVARAKEAAVLRPHGHVLRSGEARWVDPGHLGVTCYAAGIFGAQAYLGNPNLARR